MSWWSPGGTCPVISLVTGKEGSKVDLDRCKAWRCLAVRTGFSQKAAKAGGLLPLCSRFGHPEGESFWQGARSSLLHTSLGSNGHHLSIQRDAQQVTADVP